MHRSRLSTLLARIGRAGGAEAARATVAAGLTWQTCARLLHIPDPYAGAVAAVLIVETTAAATVSAATRYAAGCLMGVLLAVPGALYAEPGMAGLAVVVFASVLLARHGFLGHHGLHVPTTALIAFALVRGRHPDELAAHLAEMVLGLAFGLACSVLLFPAVRVRSAERALEELRLLVARSLDGLADAVVRQERPRTVLGPAWEDDLGRALTRARTAVGEAHESLRWNVRPTARRRRWHLDDRVLGTLTDVAGQVTATGRLLDVHPDAAEDSRSGPAFTQPYARLLRTTALCAYSCRGGRPHPALPAARQALARLGAPGCDPPDRAATDRPLLRPLESALTCLSSPAPAPPARSHRLLDPLRPSPRR
ncbi:FUSC family protein [Streptomyces barringtoniae]|uniref:FUSC family protein n=1 Tax=Streptomyces barringtoniae TaxID=2892029 RepID=UPI001E4C1E08|nr:FUSC family protein [Streptomyces barringtoniae]MCC5477681.1 FUSC family protein [Streptomyces barringtoniae]